MNDLASTEFKDRSKCLVGTGVILIIFGGLCLLVMLLMILAMLISAFQGGPEMTPSMMLGGLFFYLALGAWFIIMGIGSIKKRRWTRALILVTSWICLISGVAGIIGFFIFMPNMYENMPPIEGVQLPPNFASIMKYSTLGGMFFFSVFIPGVFILIFASKDVKSTCEAKDPRVRWTDKCPLSVLAVSLMYFFGALSTLSLGLYNWALPFFGLILSEGAGAMLALPLACLFVYLAWGLYKLDIRAWRGAVLLTIAGFISSGLTFSKVSLINLYEKMNFPLEQMEMMKQSNLPQGAGMILWMGLYFVAFLGYFLYIKKYFTSGENTL